MLTDNPDFVNSVIITEGNSLTHIEGPFEFERDGGNWEVVMPVSEDDVSGTISEYQAENMSSDNERKAISLRDGEPASYGTVLVTDYLEDESVVVLAVDDAVMVSSVEIEREDIDLLN